MRLSRKWGETNVIEHILSRRTDERLNAQSYVKAYPDVYAAAQRVFGNWGAAIAASGLDYAKIRRYRQWSRTKVLAEIKGLKKDGKPINSNAAQRMMRPLYLAALKRFGSWGKAVKAAGFDYDGVRLRRKTSKGAIKAEIQRIHAKGESLAYPNMRSRYQWLLAAGMKRLGDGSWAKARKACGIKENFRKHRHARRKPRKA